MHSEAVATTNYNSRIKIKITRLPKRLGYSVTRFGDLLDSRQLLKP